MENCIGGYVLRDREAGNIIATFTDIRSAEQMLNEYEKEDKHQGIYTYEFYEIVENTEPWKA